MKAPKWSWLIAALAVLATMLPATSAAQGGTLYVELDGTECVAGVSSNLPLEQTGPASYSTGGLKLGDVVSVSIKIADLRRCSVSEVRGALGWFIERNVLHVNVLVQEGDNRVFVKLAYSPAKKVYIAVNATDPSCVSSVEANAPVVGGGGGIWTAGPWSEGDQAELRAMAAEGCYIAGWTQDGKAVSTSERYNFQAVGNTSLTVVAERRGSRPPSQPLFDFTVLTVKAVGPGRIAASTKPIEGGVAGTPIWQGSLSPGQVIYVEAIPEGCGEFREWRGMKKLAGVDTASIAIITEPGYMDIEAVFAEMNPCPYIAVGSYRLMRYDDLPIAAGIVGGGAAAAVAYRSVRVGRRERKMYKEILPKWSEEVLLSAASYLTHTPYGIIASLIKEYPPPEVASEYRYLAKVLRSGIVQDILHELDICTGPVEMLAKITDYKSSRLESMSRQGYWAGRLLTAYISFRGYAPVLKPVLEAWVEKAPPINSADDAERFMKLLETDDDLLKMQRDALNAVREELARNGFEDIVDNPPKPIRRAVEEILEPLTSHTCPSCGQPVKGGSYCTACGARLLSWRDRLPTAEEEPQLQDIRNATPERPRLKPRPEPALKTEQPKPTHTVTEGVVEKAACPLCGAAVRVDGRYCQKCGANIQRYTTLLKPAPSPREGLREEGRRVKELVTKTAKIQPPPPKKEAEDIDSVKRFAEKRPEAKPDVKELVAPKPKPDAAAVEKHAENEYVEESVLPKPVKETTELGKGEAVQPKAVQTIEASPKTAPELAEAGVEWEPDEDLLEYLRSLGIPETDFRREALSLARLGEEDNSYERGIMRSANRLASLVQGIDEDFRVQTIMSLSQHLRDAAFVLRKELRPPAPPVKPHPAIEKPTATREQPRPLTPPPPPQPSIEPVKPAQAEKAGRAEAVAASADAKAQPAPKPQPQPAAAAEVIAEEVAYEELSGKLTPGHVYVLDIPRSALPTSVVTRRLGGVANIEKVTSVDPGTPVALTRTNYRANYKSPIRPSPNHPYVRRLAKLAPNVRCAVVTEEIYGMLKEAFAGLKPVRVRLDDSKTAERLESKGIEKEKAARLAKLFTLLPDALDTFLEEGVEGLKKRLVELIGQEDGEEVHEAVKAVLYGDAKYANKSLMISLGMMEDEAG